MIMSFRLPFVAGEFRNLQRAGVPKRLAHVLFRVERSAASRRARTAFLIELHDAERFV
jgi:hypothetical protein